jgi:hypothetical protein
MQRTYAFRTAVLVLAVFICGSAFAAAVWKWVDKKGVTHYSDQPVPGAVQVDLSVQTYDSRDATIPPTNRPITSSSRPSSNTDASAYSNIAITSPTNEQTFSGTGGQISVAVHVEPNIQAGDTIRLELDGLTVSQPNSTTTSFQLEDVARGAHSISASIVGSDGEVLKQSAAVTFYVQQTTVTRNKR